MSSESEIFFVTAGTLWHLQRAWQHQTGFIYFLPATAVLPGPSG